MRIIMSGDYDPFTKVPARLNAQHRRARNQRRKPLPGRRGTPVTWLREGPSRQVPMKAEDLKPRPDLKAQLDAFCAQHGITLDDDDDA